MIIKVNSAGYVPVLAIPSVAIDEWFLPSIQELERMYDAHVLGHGSFTSGIYWSSTEDDDGLGVGHAAATQAYMIDFSDGTWYWDNKSMALRVRPLRIFNAGIGDYVIGDTGPADGIIVYVQEGDWYFEVSATDLSASHVWSNIDDTEIGATAQGQGLNSGETNTDAIIGQAGHIDSAAKLCYDLSI